MRLAEHSTCVGCGACAQKCPKSCITMKPSPTDGFLYPTVDAEKCIDCGTCAKVCPIFMEHEKANASKAYAFQTEDESILKNSSSGGLFSTLAIDTIERGGVVFGARFTNDWQVEIDYTENRDGIVAFRGAKYVQAKVGDSYKKAKSFLDSGRSVLFSGTPCQIAGLKSFLNKDFDNLLTIDLICHGVPSPMAWKKYLDEQGENITNVCFRDKSTGWKKYSFFVGNTYEAHWKNDYMKAFLSNLDLRLSCSSCKFKAGASGSDVTIGDFWGIDKIKPESDNDNGMCCVFLNSAKGEQVCTNIITSEPFPIEIVEEYNPSYSSPSFHNANRAFFFKHLQNESFTVSYEKAISQNLNVKIGRKIFRLTHK